jgi:hypothetical protein
MTLPERASQDGGLERAERLNVIQDFWRADAVRLNTAVGTDDERVARSTYVVDLLAMVDWENQGRKVIYTMEQRARRLNDLYRGGLKDATYRHGGSMAPEVRYSIDDWRHFDRTQLYPHIMHRTPEPPATLFELVHALHNGDAKFDYEPEPTS